MLNSVDARTHLSLFYSTVDLEWSVVVDCSLHVVMEGGDHTQ